VIAISFSVPTQSRPVLVGRERAQNYVTSITQTTDGYLWIGTYNGLARFDGVRFVTYDPDSTGGLGHAHIHMVLADLCGTLWVSTFDNGLSRWREGTFTFEWRGTITEGGVRKLLLSRSNEVLFSLSSGQVLRGTTTAAGSNQWKVLATGLKRLIYREAARL
jgi:ligand-binding sensor domain-containing protein